MRVPWGSAEGREPPPEPGTKRVICTTKPAAVPACRGSPSASGSEGSGDSGHRRWCRRASWASASASASVRSGFMASIWGGDRPSRKAGVSGLGTSGTEIACDYGSYGVTLCCYGLGPGRTHSTARPWGQRTNAIGDDLPTLIKGRATNTTDYPLHSPTGKWPPIT